MIYLYRIGPQLDLSNMKWQERIDASVRPLVPALRVPGMVQAALRYEQFLATREASK